ncbi:hypothetical protein ACXYTJ_13520 [Gilvimarinus sp. F26214L]|uniref:hypothetical protein n=1 Tax=Gilvimarinus sp. DZF01 TaxID=3461371 RepID=UPI0040465790
MRKTALILFATLAAAANPGSAEDAGEGEGTRLGERRFIACPVYRDSDAGPKSGCWLATNRESGERFDVSGARSKPMIGRQILVEGLVSDLAADSCGATVLEPVRVSVLPERCPEYIIAGENYPGRKFALPPEVMQPLSVPRTLPEGPYEDRTFTILFNFDSSFLNYQYSEIILEKAALYIRASEPASVEVLGFAATESYGVSGRVLRESLDLAKARAEQVALALGRLVPGVKTDIQWKGSPEVISQSGAAGLDEESRRRVEIRISVD